MKKVLISIDWSDNAEKAFDCKLTVCFAYFVPMHTAIDPVLLLNR